MYTRLMDKVQSDGEVAAIPAAPAALISAHFLSLLPPFPSLLLKSGSYSVADSDFEHAKVFLSQLLKFWGYRCELLHLARSF